MIFASQFFRRFGRNAALAAVLLTLPALNACAPAVVGAGATVGLAAFQERGVEGVTRDSALAAQVLSKYVNENSDLAAKIGVEVWESRALLTGTVETDGLRAEAVNLAWQISGIKDVINEIQIKGAEGIENFAYDAWISAQLTGRLTFDDEIYAINYDVETVNGVVYLIGIAQNQVEHDRVVAHAREIARVRRVISHVRIKSASSDGGT